LKKRKLIKLSILISIIIAVMLWTYARYFYQDIWSIGIYAGPNPVEFSSYPLVGQNPVLAAGNVTDVQASFVADPFLIYDNKTWHMFFEVFNASSDQGDIGLATSKDEVNWKYEKIVLDEPFHLSYPYIFKWNESYYMIPESRRGAAIKLYKAEEFPEKWSFLGDMIVGDYADPSIIFWDGKWWLFALKGQDELTLHYAENPTGPWIEHPKSPLIKGNAKILRPGGRLTVYGEKIIRYAQGDDPVYGTVVRAFQIDEMTETDYKDHEITQSPILRPSGHGWNSAGMHHIDPYRIDENKWIACVDGKRREKAFVWKAAGRRILNRFKRLMNSLH
jgi:hypothetical protein